uniref:Uncharacterized protein n=1 Tax=Arundo donax TaxID=35708 RepID=A0A0A9HC40_ARUDO
MINVDFHIPPYVVFLSFADIELRLNIPIRHYVFLTPAHSFIDKRDKGHVEKQIATKAT